MRIVLPLLLATCATAYDVTIVTASDEHSEVIRNILDRINVYNYDKAVIGEIDCIGAYSAWCEGLNKDTSIVYVEKDSDDFSHSRDNRVVIEAGASDDEIARAIFSLVAHYGKLQVERLAGQGAAGWDLPAPVINTEAGTIEELASLIETSTNAHTTFALFWKPDSIESVSAASAFDDISEKETIDLKSFNCDSVDCSDAKPEQLPVIRAYRNENVYRLYTGPDWSAKALHDWIRMILQPEVALLTEDRVPYYRSGLLPGFEGEVRHTMNLLFIPDKKHRVFNDFHRLASEMHGVGHFAAFVSEEVSKWSHQPAIVTMKPTEHVMAYTLYKDMSYPAMQAYIHMTMEDHVYPITDAVSALAAFSPAPPLSPRPLVIAFDPLETANLTLVRMMASDMDFRSRHCRVAEMKGLKHFKLQLASRLGVEDLTRAQMIYIDAETGHFSTLPYSSVSNHVDIAQWIVETENDFAIQRDRDQQEKEQEKEEEQEQEGFSLTWLSLSALGEQKTSLVDHLRAASKINKHDEL